MNPAESVVLDIFREAAGTGWGVVLPRALDEDSAQQAPRVGLNRQQIYRRALERGVVGNRIGRKRNLDVDEGLRRLVKRGILGKERHGTHIVYVLTSVAHALLKEGS